LLESSEQVSRAKKVLREWRKKCRIAEQRVAELVHAASSRDSAGDRSNADPIVVTEQNAAELDSMVRAFASATPRLPALIRHMDLAD
jgi:hypothetical protein